MNHFFRFLWLLFASSLLYACTPTTSSSRLPTLMPTAVLSTPIATTPVTSQLQATFTPIPVPENDTNDSNTLQPTFTPAAAESSNELVDESDVTTAVSEAEPVADVPLAEITTDPAQFVLYENPEAGIRIQHPPELWPQDLGDIGVRFMLNGNLSISTSDNRYEGTVFTITLLDLSIFGEPEEGKDPVAYLNSVVTEFDDRVEIIEAPTTTTMNGQPAATAQINIKPFPDSDKVIRNYNYVALFDEEILILIQGDSDVEDAAIFAPIFQKMLNTVELTDPWIP